MNNCFSKKRYPSEQPYEKLEKYGTFVLSDRELLSVLLQTGISGMNVLEVAGSLLEYLEPYGGLQGLAKLELSDLVKRPGIGKVKAFRLKAAVELAVRLSRSLSVDKISFNCPGVVADYYMESLCYGMVEEVHLIFLDTGLRYLGEHLLSIGSATASLVPVRELFLSALKANASYLILIHNHPSGNPNPSEEDFEVTERIRLVGDLLQIPLQDHIILGDHRFYSFREHGYLEH